MTGLEVTLLAALLLVLVLGIAGQNAAYRNGCVDGYGYSKEPHCPGYRKAGYYLRTTMQHRWPELADDTHNRFRKAVQ